MKTSIISVFLTSSLLISLSGYAQAGYEITPQLVHFDYHESDASGSTLNREKGLLPAIEVAADGQLKNLSSRLYAGAMSGSVDYDGHTQGGGSYDTNTKQDIFHLGAELDIEVHQNISVVLAWSRYWWRRDIQPKGIVQGLTEDYRWDLPEAGVRLRYQGWQLDALYNRTFNAQMVIQPTNCTGRVTLHPEAGEGYSMKLTLDRNTFHPYIYFKRSRMERSDPETGHSCFGRIQWQEPDNQMDIITFGTSVRF